MKNKTVSIDQQGVVAWVDEEQSTTKTLTSKQRIVLEALFYCRTLKDVETMTGVAVHTIKKWMQTPSFRSAMMQAERDAIGLISVNMHELTQQALDAFQDALSIDSKLHYRLKAAEIVTDRLLKIRESLNLERRLDELEEKYEQLTQQSHTFGTTTQGFN